MLKEYLNANNMSVYALSKGSGIPYTTLNELVNNKKDIEECSFKTVSRLAAYLGITVERLYNIVCSKSQSRPTPSSSWNDAKDKKYAFPVIVASDNYDASRIHPLKQKLAMKISKKLRNDTRISELILFGSSTTIRCNNKSDMDFAVQLKNEYINNFVKDEISEEIQSICDWKADIIWMDRITEKSKIYNNISKGVRLI